MPEEHDVHSQHEHTAKKTDKQISFSWAGLLLFLAVIIFAVCIPAFVVRSYQVDGQSMETTLDDNDRLIVDKVPRTIARITGHPYIPHRGDIIIFNEGGLPGTPGSRTLIKRVVGLPSEHIVVKDGSVRIFSQTHPNGLNPDADGAYKIQKPTSGNIDVKLAPDQLYVMGDNRPESEDSRYFGPITADQIIGKLVLRFWPPGKAESF